jgi:hypothetical protein
LTKRKQRSIVEVEKEERREKDEQEELGGF